MKTFLTAILLLFVTAVNAQMASLENMLVYEMPHSHGAKKLTLKYYRYSFDGKKRDSIPAKHEHFILDKTGLVDTAFYVSRGVYMVDLYTHDPVTRYVKTYTRARGGSFSDLSLQSIDTFTYVKVYDTPLTVQRRATSSKHLSMRFVLPDDTKKGISSNESMGSTFRLAYTYDEKNRKKTERKYYSAVLENFRTYTYNQWDDIADEDIADNDGHKFRTIRSEYTYDAKGNWLTKLETWINFDSNNQETDRYAVYYITREIEY